MTAQVHESGLSWLQKVQFYIGSGGRSIISGLVNCTLFPFIAKWIRQLGTKMVLTRMIIVSMVGYVLLTFVPETRGDALDMVKVFGLEIPAESSYWLATLVYFVVYVGFSAVYTANGPIGKRLIDFFRDLDRSTSSGDGQGRDWGVDDPRQRHLRFSLYADSLRVWI